jgi:hypothetical protein
MPTIPDYFVDINNLTSEDIVMPQRSENPLRPSLSEEPETPLRPLGATVSVGNHVPARNGSPRPQPTPRQVELASQLRTSEGRMLNAEPLQFLEVSRPPRGVEQNIRLIIYTPCCLHIQNVNLNMELKGHERLCRSCSDTHGTIKIITTCVMCGQNVTLILKEW